jgi:hypothetical protein
MAQRRSRTLGSPPPKIGGWSTSSFDRAYAALKGRRQPVCYETRWNAWNRLGSSRAATVQERKSETNRVRFSGRHDFRNRLLPAALSFGRLSVRLVYRCGSSDGPVVGRAKARQPSTMGSHPSGQRPPANPFLTTHLLVLIWVRLGRSCGRVDFEGGDAHAKTAPRLSSS